MINPITSDNPTAQEVFNTAYIGVVSQGVPSVTKEGRCAYRGVNGTACGIGHLIDDDLAIAWDSTEKSAIFALVLYPHMFDDSVPKALPWMRKHSELLDRIQLAHDNARRQKENFTAYFKQEMADIAKLLDLTIPTNEVINMEATQ